MKRNLLRLTLLTCSFTILMCGCDKQLINRATATHEVYNTAVSKATSNEILLNIVRAHNHEAPTFLAISSVTTSNSFTTPSLSINQNAFSGTDLLTQTSGSLSSSGISYSPNITFTPNSGAEYANQLLTPLSMKAIGQIAYAETNIGLLLRLTVGKLGPWENFPPIPMEHNLNHVLQDEKNFQSFCDIIQEVYANNGHRLYFKKITPTQPEDLKQQRESIALIIPISDNFTFTQRQLSLLKPLNIDNNSENIKLTLSIARISDTISITPRTLVSTLKYLSTMIEDVPHSHAIASIQPIISKNFFSIKTSQDEPKKAYASVEKEGTWYYISNDDEYSKQTFEALELLFNITRIVPQNSSTVLISN